MWNIIKLYFKRDVQLTFFCTVIGFKLHFCFRSIGPSSADCPAEKFRTEEHGFAKSACSVSYEPLVATNHRSTTR